MAVLSGEGKHFCAGIDLTYLMEQNQAHQDNCEGRKREKFWINVNWLQDTVTAIERCRKPVLAAVDNGCIGAGVDIITACDMRYCTENAYFSVREIDMAIVADLGTLQRLPTIVGQGMAREMAFSGRKVSAHEAKDIQLVNRVYGKPGRIVGWGNGVCPLIGLQISLDHARDEGKYELFS